MFIFESIGTQELLLVGFVALIFLGPRKLPELAKKAGKIMTEFRGTANEFKQTWEKEVSFEEEAKSLSLETLDAEVISRDTPLESPETTTIIPDAPAIRSIDPSSFSDLVPAAGTELQTADSASAETAPANDKKNWL